MLTAICYVAFTGSWLLYDWFLLNFFHFLLSFKSYFHYSFTVEQRKILMTGTKGNGNVEIIARMFVVVRKARSEHA